MTTSTQDPNRIRFALHGGAGDPPPGAGAQPEQRAALQRVTAEALALLRDGASALDAVTRAVELMEDCPLFNAGIGAVLSRDGQPELDAAIVNGADRACGAVTGISRVRSPIRFARAIMERTPHVFFGGAGAERLAAELGMEMVEPGFFITAERLHQLEAARRAGAITLDHDDHAFCDDDAAFGTVGAVARDAQGHLAAATSTGGLTNKHVGRVGDSPIVGAGTYALNGACAISATGHGEYFIRYTAASEVCARVRYRGESIEAASREVIEELKQAGGEGGLIALDAQGNIAMPYSSPTMLRGQLSAGKAAEVVVETKP